MTDLDCVFCKKLADWQKVIKVGAEFSIWRFEPLNPVTPGHMLFVAEKHFRMPHNSPRIAAAVFEEATKYAFERPVDYNLIVNAGQNAGQTVQHMHIHYVPRQARDGLQMPWSEQQRQAAEKNVVDEGTWSELRSDKECVSCSIVQVHSPHEYYKALSGALYKCPGIAR